MPAASSIYFNSEDSQRSSADGSEPSSSSSGGRRRYIDPWDLENYAYLRRRQIEIVLPRSSDPEGIQKANLTRQVNESGSDSYYWYPMTTATGETSGYDTSSPVDELYNLGSSHQVNQPLSYPMQQATYEDDARYVTSNPVYVPLSDIECPETAVEPHNVPNVLPRRRNRLIKDMAQYMEECPCPFHGPLQPEIAMAKDAASVKQAKQLGLNTYGHLRIDYARSWNSLHRKMKK
ncbi:uncharacterized protein LOC124410790 [Diprion similis]|uniref:uncharacterized protein LOC124410790 n=1 Tax=Diprion similis TaxID=362088 RepID=UPI001EF96A12|nr:uncharacterized protein LOC124410790 [Diprion similis]